MRNDEAPLPEWRQRWAMMRYRWLRGKDRRQRAYRTLRNAGAKAVGFAFEGGGATLISFGIHQVYGPAGYITAGLLLWVLLWSAKKDSRKEGGR